MHLEEKTNDLEDAINGVVNMLLREDEPTQNEDSQIEVLS